MIVGLRVPFSLFPWFGEHFKETLVSTNRVPQGKSEELWENPEIVSPTHVQAVAWRLIAQPNLLPLPRSFCRSEHAELALDQPVFYL